MFLTELPIRTRLWLQRARDQFRRGPSSKTVPRRRLELSALEERVLLSASPLGGLLDSVGTLLFGEGSSGEGDGSVHISIPENTNTIGGVSVGALLAADVEGNPFSYSIEGGADANLFSIGGENSDELILNTGGLDFEVESQYEVVVRVTNLLGEATDQRVVVEIEDVNESPTGPGFRYFDLAENTDTTGGLTLGTLSATDPDADDSLTFSIIGGRDADLFSIGGADANELIVDAGPLDYETQIYYEVEIRITDSAGNSFDQRVGLLVDDVSEPPVPGIAAFALQENSPAGTLVGSLAGFGEGNTLQIVSGNVGGAFAIDPLTGELRVADSGPIDFETRPTFDLIVALDDGTTVGSVQVSLQNVSIPPTAVDDTVRSEIPMFHFTYSDFIANDISPEGEKLLIVGFADLGGGQIIDHGDQLFTYIVPEEGSGPFQFTYIIQDDSGNVSSATMTVLFHRHVNLPAGGSQAPQPADFPLPSREVVPQPPARPAVFHPTPQEESRSEDETRLPAVVPAPPYAVPADGAVQTHSTAVPFITGETGRENTQHAAAEWQADPLPREEWLVVSSPALLREWTARTTSAEGPAHRPEPLPGSTSDWPAEEAILWDMGEGSMVWQDLDQMESDVNATADLQQLVVGAAVTVSTTLTVGYVLWMIRGGVLVGSLIAQMPAWRFVDPLPILEHLTDDLDLDSPDEESLETILEATF